MIRPADPEETAAAYAASIDRKDGPTALILTRQNVRTLKEIPVSISTPHVKVTGYDCGISVSDGVCECFLRTPMTSLDTNIEAGHLQKHTKSCEKVASTLDRRPK